jgi:hypothetical protein
MSQTTESKNKALVLEAFDTLFNKYGYVAAERYWSPDYIFSSKANTIIDRVEISGISNQKLAFERRICPLATPF